MGPLDNNLRFQETVVALREARQQVLASNIANADTPNYKARDFDFSSALQQAMSTSQNQASAGGPAGAASTASQPGMPPLLYRVPQQDSLNGNTVDVDAERNEFTDNALRYEASLTMITGQIKLMLSAIQG